MATGGQPRRHEQALRRLRQNAAVRAVGFPVARTYARVRGGPPPRVFLNSVPKSGTHLVKRVLDLLPDMRFAAYHLTAYDFANDGVVDWDAAARMLNRVPHGHYATGHLPASDELFARLDRLGFRRLFVIRDPRDAAVSDVHYITRHPKHPLHRRLLSIPPDRRLYAVLSGLPDQRNGIPLMESVAARLASYQGWFEDPRCLVVRFEDLVGARGDGDVDRQVDVVQAIARHVDRPLTDDAADAVAAAAWSPRSSTFRRGRTGDWRAEFSVAERCLVKRLAGDRLVAYGYEQGVDW
jgi:sulfotransferase 6B1